MFYMRAKEPGQMLGLAPAQPATRPVQPTTAPDHVALCAAANAALEPHMALWLQHQPALQWAATTQFLQDFAASTKAHGVAVLYAVRDIPLPPEGCVSADQRRAELVSAMAAEFGRLGMRFVDWSTRVAATTGQRDLRPLQGFGMQRGDGHLNFDGHRAWASTLAELLKAELPNLPAHRQTAL
jgi:hypothetical protein